MQAVYDRLVAVLTDKFQVAASDIGPDISLSDLEFDSLAVVELYVTLQEDWNVELEEDDSAAEMTLKKFAESVELQLRAAPSPTGQGAGR